MFVAYSLNQNTDAIQGSTENVLFERQAELSGQVMQDPSLAAILVKRRNDKREFTEVEALRWELYELGLLDIWALAHTRHQRELLGDRQWIAWDTYFTHLFSNSAEKMGKERWQELEYGFDRGFWVHVGEVRFPQ